LFSDGRVLEGMWRDENHWGKGYSGSVDPLAQEGVLSKVHFSGRGLWDETEAVFCVTVASGLVRSGQGDMLRSKGLKDATCVDWFGDDWDCSVGSPPEAIDYVSSSVPVGYTV